MADSISQSQATIALLDDNPASSGLIAAWLHRLGLGPCLTWKDPYEGLRTLMIEAQNGKQPRIVICRSAMRTCSAVDVIHTLRRIPGWSQIPILILREHEDVSEKSDHNSQHALLEAGATEFLEWPTTESDLLRALSR